MCLEAIGWVCQVIRGREGRQLVQRRAGRLGEGIRARNSRPQAFCAFYTDNDKSWGCEELKSLG